MRVLLIKPPFNELNFVRHFAVCEPLEFEVLAAKIDAWHDVRIVDLRADRRSLEVYLNAYDPDLVGFTALSMDVNTVIKLTQRVKRFNREIITCVGGEHASLVPKDFEIPEMDFIFRYDASNSFPQFLRSVEQIWARYGKGCPIRMHLHQHQVNNSVNDNLKTLPLPRRDLCEKYQSKYIYGCATPVSLIQTTAGCPYRCSYCSIPARQLKYVLRSIDVILEDIASTKSPFLLSIDANALHNVKWASRLYKEIADAKLGKKIMISCRTDTIVKHPEILDTLRQAGVDLIACGIETLNDAKLRDYNKANTGLNNRHAVDLCHENGIMVRGNFIVDQQFSKDDFRRLADYVIASGIEFPTFQILTPLPGTSFYEQVKDQIITRNLDYFDLQHSVLPTLLPTEEFYEEFKGLFDKCYSARRLFWLARKVPVIPAVKGLIAATRSHLGFSYGEHFEEAA